MYYVYVLRDKNNKIYIGYTNNLKRRLYEHFSHKTYWVRRLYNPELFYYEAYITQEYAKERETKLKQYGSSFQGLKKRLRLL